MSRSLKDSVIYHMNEITQEDEKASEDLIEEIIEAVQEEHPNESDSRIRELIEEQYEQ